jgi:hypothetical protein
MFNTEASLYYFPLAVAFALSGGAFLAVVIWDM